VQDKRWAGHSFKERQNITFGQLVYHCYHYRRTPVNPTPSQERSLFLCSPHEHSLLMIIPPALSLSPFKVCSPNRVQFRSRVLRTPSHGLHVPREGNSKQPLQYTFYLSLYTETSTLPSFPGPPLAKEGKRYVISSQGCRYRPVRRRF